MSPIETLLPKPQGISPVCRELMFEAFDFVRTGRTGALLHPAVLDINDRERYWEGKHPEVLATPPEHAAAHILAFAIVAVTEESRLHKWHTTQAENPNPYKELYEFGRKTMKLADGNTIGGGTFRTESIRPDIVAADVFCMLTRLPQHARPLTDRQYRQALRQARPAQQIEPVKPEKAPSKTQKIVRALGASAVAAGILIYAYQSYAQNKAVAKAAPEISQLTNEINTSFNDLGAEQQDQVNESINGHGDDILYPELPSSADQKARTDARVVYNNIIRLKEIENHIKGGTFGKVLKRIGQIGLGIGTMTFLGSEFARNNEPTSHQD